MNTKEWSVERVMFAFGGSLVILLAILTAFVHPAFIYGVLFLGCMFLIFAITGYCPGAIVAGKIMNK